MDPAIVEAAQGIGMNRWRRLLRVELPMAWPVILTGMRLSALLIVGIAAIGALVNGPGLGNFIFSGLDRLGSATATPQILDGHAGDHRVRAGARRGVPRPGLPDDPEGHPMTATTTSRRAGPRRRVPPPAPR